MNRLLAATWTVSYVASMPGNVAIWLSTSPATSSGTRWTFMGAPVSALSGQFQSGSSVHAMPRPASSAVCCGPFQMPLSPVQVFADVRNADGGIRDQLMLQREVDLVDVFHRERGVDRRPCRAEFDSSRALFVQLGAQLARAVVDPICVRIEEGVPDPCCARRIGIRVRVGEIEVVAAEVPLEHGTSAPVRTRRPIVAPKCSRRHSSGPRPFRWGRSRRGRGWTPRQGSRCAVARSARPGLATANRPAATCPGRTAAWWRLRLSDAISPSAGMLKSMIRSTLKGRSFALSSR